MGRLDELSEHFVAGQVTLPKPPTASETLPDSEDALRYAFEPPAAAREGIEAVQGAAGTPVDRFLAMSPQARWALKKASIFTLEAAAARSDEELLAIVGFGESSLVKLRAWQEDPSVIQAGVRAPAADPREDRIFGLYACLRGAGHTKEKARELAAAEVDALAAHLRGGA